MAGMQILSDYRKDTRTEKVTPGSYEWWYFDGTDSRGRYGFTVIFYEGNPFSPRYIKRQKSGRFKEPAKAEDHPAVSISVYENRKPVYYSFTEFSPAECSFGMDQPGLRFGNHAMETEVRDDRLIYRLNLEEELASGDRLEGSVVFESPEVTGPDLGKATGEGHRWNLVQPSAHVTAELDLSSFGRTGRRISFTGLGYHDHNTGGEPMKNEFLEWNWGRFHFEEGTLVYYIMEQEDGSQHVAWLISPDNRRVVSRFKAISMEDRGWTRFGLRSPRKIVMSGDDADVTVQHTAVLDDGPFYQRFGSDAFLNIKGSQQIESADGIAEYIRPERIHWRLFWPLTGMRIRYSKEPAHWVQRSPRLYRLTW